MGKRPLVGKSVRKLVADRARRRCEYCKSPEQYSIDAFTVDHIVPISADGTGDAENLAYACLGCNLHKGSEQDAKDPATGQAASLFNPRASNWEDHFQWSDDTLLIVPKTDVGRATLALLKLNRPGIVNLRRALLLIGGEDPPVGP